MFFFQTHQYHNHGITIVNINRFSTFNKNRRNDNVTTRIDRNCYCGVSTITSETGDKIVRVDATDFACKKLGRNARTKPARLLRMVLVTAGFAETI